LGELTNVTIRTLSKRQNYDILYKKNSIRLPDNTTLEERKKTLYYHFTRSLFDLFISSSNNNTIPGSVFDEQIPQNITCTPVDAFLMNKLYADDFHEQFKNQFIQRFSYRMYLVQMYGAKLYTLFFILSLLIPSILLIRLIIKGAFRPHHWNWKEYNKQGLFLIFIYGLYLLINTLSDLEIELKLHIVLISFFQALIAINLIYFAEWFIFSKRPSAGASKIIVIFPITLIGLTIPFLYGMNYSISSGIMNQSTSSSMPFLNIILLSLARSLYLFLNDRYKSIINQKDVELAQMGEFQKQAELQSLRAKINPHFLYNALNSIASLATTDARKTEQMALALSDFFKYAINREQKQLNTLSEELNAIRTYLEIEKVRFGDRLSFEIDCPEELLNIQIPQLLIQPLVENAIKHGLSQITENGLIGILVCKEENQLKVRVYDNGPAFPDGPLSGFGIQNTQERIALLYGVKATINWQNGVEKYVEISIPV
jgi:two-component system LytT family sensor kinase